MRLLRGAEKQRMIKKRRNKNLFSKKKNKRRTKLPRAMVKSTGKNKLNSFIRTRRGI